MKPYTFNSAPFIADNNSIQQGYVNYEPYDVEKNGHFKPNVFLLADYGFSTYSTTIEARLDTVAQQARSRATLRRCDRGRLVSLPLRRQFQGDCR